MDLPRQIASIHYKLDHQAVSALTTPSLAPACALPDPVVAALTDIHKRADAQESVMTQMLDRLKQITGVIMEVASKCGLVLPDLSQATDAASGAAMPLDELSSS
jgi:hypothetical protein